MEEGIVKINYEDDNLKKELAYNIGSTSLDAMVANVHIQIKQDVEFYEIYLTFLSATQALVCQQCSRPRQHRLDKGSTSGN